ncbi:MULTISPECIES: hypothetical protein [unclassified Methylibium]|uniref:hypothetical protein n=1 Tax=unclassified Methylibium TaxID=2633235 RepID=UPI0003F4369A|nr:MULTISPECIES: hypothetical protein [unclassified Methylibium]EWS52856.1 Carbapenem-hydrolyzing beta-lactamase Sme-1 precursor [Methylibium sp. T29]EWS57901.1 Carbapenem-hydrolyzing beta-lactamase Sme-1 precursor [Methylibium sp. T29-B]
MKRRNFSVGMAFSAFGFSAIFPKKSFALGEQGQMTAVFQQLEAKAQGRLGVHVIDTATGHEFGYRSDELFMMLSSFKLLASAWCWRARIVVKSRSLGVFVTASRTWCLGRQ